jgi:hypothetical protein
MAPDIAATPPNLSSRRRLTAATGSISLISAFICTELSLLPGGPAESCDTTTFAGQRRHFGWQRLNGFGVNAAADPIPPQTNKYDGSMQI